MRKHKDDEDDEDEEDEEDEEDKEYPDKSSKEQSSENKNVVYEREINLTLINEKINFIISLLQKPKK